MRQNSTGERPDAMRRALILGAASLPVAAHAQGAPMPRPSTSQLFIDRLGRAPERPRPIGKYVPARRVTPLVFLSATPAKYGSTILHPGVLGRDLDVEAGHLSARAAMLTLLEYLWFDLDGSLSPIEQIVSLTGYVASAPGFFRQAEVMDGASDVLVEIFGPDALPTRTSIGVVHMPRNASVAVSAVVEISRASR